MEEMFYNIAKHFNAKQDLMKVNEYYWCTLYNEDFMIKIQSVRWYYDRF